jgi:peptidoglycan/LPS O-acetylase OafA/YrhL
MTPSDTSTNTKGKYYPVLTGVRALAAFMVYFDHYNPFISNNGKIVYNYPLACLFKTLFVGVSIFFVLSGFLITSRYQQSIQLNWQWARRYVRNRIARIYPMYFIITIIAFIASQIDLSYDPSNLWQFYAAKDKLLVLFLNLTFLRGFFENFRFTLAGQGWSLTVEECFYLSAPLLLLGLRRRPWRLAAYPLVLLGVGIGLVMLFSPFHGRLYGLFGSMKFMLNWTFLGRCVEFLLGMALALFMARRPAASAPPRQGWVTAAGLLWMAVCLGMLAYLERDTSVNATHLESYWSFLVMNAIFPIGIIIWFWGLMHENTFFRRVLETPIADLLGKSSYVFYLIHVGVLNFLLNNFVTNNIYIKFFIINIVAIGLYKLVEHPLHAWLTKRS